MIESLTDELKNWIRTNAQVLFPELFDDANAKSKLDLLTSQSWIHNKQFVYKTDDDALKQLILMYTAHLLAQSEASDGNAQSVHLNDLSVSYSNNVTNGDDPYLEQYNELLNSLDLDGWEIEF